MAQLSPNQGRLGHTREINGMIPSTLRLVPWQRDHVASDSDFLPPLDTPHRLSGHVRRAIVDARGWLLDQQHDDGRFCGRLASDCRDTAAYMLLLALVDKDTQRLEPAGRWLLQQQSLTGGWSLYHGGPLDLDVSVLAYFALKLAGQDPGSEPMQGAREAVLAAGGADRVSGAARWYLALLGQIPYDACPAVKLADCLNDIPAAAQRLACTHQFVRQIDARRGIRELFTMPPQQWSVAQCGWMPTAASRFARQCQQRLLQTALLAKHTRLQAERLFLRQIADGAAAKNAADVIWTLVGLKCLSHADDSPLVYDHWQQLERLTIEEGQSLEVQPGQTPLADTAGAVAALQEAGLPHHDESIADAVQWLLVHPAENTRDLALVAHSLGQRSAEASEGVPTRLQLVADREASPEDSQSDLALQEQLAAAVGKAQRDLLSLQVRQGGWGDAARTGEALEALGSLGRRAGDLSIDRAIRRLAEIQQADGSWISEQGDSRIYVTAQVVLGLAAAGVPAEDPLLAAAINWLLAFQQACGGWGESPAAQQDPQFRGQGPVTASQTSWALLALIAAGMHEHPAVVRGVRFLVSDQCDDGAWLEPELTRGGLRPDSFLRNDLDRGCLPLRALSRWQRAVDSQG